MCAYISQEEKKNLSVNIKKTLKKYGMKGTIAIRHHMVLVVNIKSGSLDVIGNWYDTVTKNGNTNQYGDVITKPEYLDVNTHWINSNYSGVVKDFLLELLENMKGPDFFCNDDIQSDYFHRSHYTDINIGKWNSPYKFEG